MLHWNDYVQIFTAVVVIVNPLAAIPVFIGLTKGQDKAGRKKAAHIAALAVAIILSIAALLGQWILKLFNIGIPSFRIAGGILLLLMSISMLRAGRSPVSESGDSDEDAAVVPLAMPLMAGPAAISTVIIYAHKTNGWVDMAFLVVTCLVTALIAWIALRTADPVSRLLGHTGINIAVRIMGLLLAAISISFITEGLSEIFPHWAG
ncbi:MAG: MarC family protein [Candidatus Zixiibacteriota bacterium]|jgi:multiple antibiotic resistance protein